MPQAKEREVVMLLRGGPNVAISMVLAMFLERYVFRRCVLNEFHSRLQWKIVCSGGAQDAKQWKSLCENDNSRFLGFFECSEFREM